MKSDTPSGTQDSNNTEEFMRLVRLFEQWFEFEEVEVTDTVLGRMASRTQTEISKARADERQKVLAEVTTLAEAYKYWDFAADIESLQPPPSPTQPTTDQTSGGER